MQLEQNVSIRAAQGKDLPTLIEFEQGVVSAERPHAFDLKEAGVVYYDLPALLNSCDAELIVAELSEANDGANEESDGELIACGYVRIDPSKPYHKSEQHGYLGFMYVAPKWRGRGINKRILDELISWGSNRGVHVYKLDVYSGNQSAIRAYEKMGFTSNLLEMALDVDL